MNERERKPREKVEFLSLKTLGSANILFKHQGS